MDYEDELDLIRSQRKKGGRGQKKSDSGRRQETSRQSVSRGDRTYYSEGVGRNPRVRYRGSSSARERIREEQKRKKKKRKILVLEILVLLVLVGGIFFFLTNRSKEEGYWTIAVFGVDSRDGNLEKGALSDVEMICSIDRATGEVKLTSIYRDTYLQIDDEGTYHKINEAYMKGGHEQAVDALNRNLDLQIDDYATFNWKAVAQGINVLGGIDVEITNAEFEYINGFITETVNSTGIGSTQLTSAGMNHLDGVQAVAYARLRLMDTDFNRTERQRKVVSLALEKAKQADFATLTSLVSAVFPEISTSIGLDDIMTLAQGVSKYYLGETTGFPFSRTTMRINKMDCVIPTTLESNVTQLHQFLYKDEAYTPSSQVKEISTHISEVSGIYEPGENAPTGGSSSGNSGGSGSVNTPAETAAPPETEIETTEEESIEETQTVEETETKEETAETDENSKPTNADGSLVGPGADLTEDSKESEKETAKADTSLEETTKADAANKETAKESDSQQPTTSEKEPAKPSQETSGPSQNKENAVVEAGPGVGPGL